MLSGKHKLMREGAEGRAVVLREQRRGAGTRDWRQYLDARLEYPDGTVVEFSGHVLVSDIGRNFFSVGDDVPVRYDPADHGQVVFDVPRLKAERADRESGRGGFQPAAGEATGEQMGDRPVREGLTPVDVEAALEQMANLGELRNTGALTGSEYEAEKAKFQALVKRRNSGAISEAEFEAENAMRVADLPRSPNN